MKKVALAVAGLLGLALTPSVASAAVTTYSLTETDTVANISTGIVGANLHNPFTFAFTVANAFAANTTYNFGVAGVENGDSGNLLDLRFSDGTALTTFTLADYHSHFEFFGFPVGGTRARFHFETDGAGGIKTFTVDGQARTPTNIQTITSFGIQGSTAGNSFAETFYYDPALFFRTTVAGDVHCNIIGHCGGVFVGAPGGIGGAGGGGGGGAGAVPEPASWALMIVGFGAAGAMLRRRRAAAFVA